MSSAKVFIRPMLEQDVERVHEIDTLSFSLPWPVLSYHFELADAHRSHCWVAEVENGLQERLLVGMIVVWLVVDEAHIATIAVHPDYRGQGIAKQLLAYALRDAACLGMAQADLEVREQNQAALRLYAQFGFQVVGRRPHYYQDNHEAALLMNAPLVPGQGDCEETVTPRMMGEEK